MSEEKNPYDDLRLLLNAKAMLAKIRTGYVKSAQAAAKEMADTSSRETFWYTVKDRANYTRQRLHDFDEELRAKDLWPLEDTN